MTEIGLVLLFLGVYNGVLLSDPREVSATRWVTAAALDTDMTRDPAAFTVWFVKYMRAGWPLAVRPAA